MRESALIGQAAQRGLSVLGAFHRDAADDLPETCQTVVLLGPDEPRFWPLFSASPEASDGKPDPMDRWSARVIGDWAEKIGAAPLFPFGKPDRPFYDWALRTGRCHASPIAFLVHDDAGLFVSFRGALALTERLDLTVQAPPAPCITCTTQPCGTACPVDALNDQGYDVDRCKAYLATADGQDCMSNGCAARRACPISQGFRRLPAQSAFHMRHFTGA